MASSKCGTVVSPPSLTFPENSCGTDFQLCHLPSATSMRVSYLCECSSLSIIDASVKDFVHRFFCSASLMMSDTLFAAFVHK